MHRERERERERGLFVSNQRDDAGRGRGFLERSNGKQEEQRWRPMDTTDPPAVLTATRHARPPGIQGRTGLSLPPTADDQPHQTNSQRCPTLLYYTPGMRAKQAVQVQPSFPCVNFFNFSRAHGQSRNLNLRAWQTKRSKEKFLVSKQKRCSVLRLRF